MRSHLDDLFADLPETLRVSQVANLLGKTNQGVLKWISTGVLPAYKLGETWFILRDDLRDALAEGGNLEQPPAPRRRPPDSPPPSPPSQPPQP